VLRYEFLEEKKMEHYIIVKHERANKELSKKGKKVKKKDNVYLLR